MGWTAEDIPAGGLAGKTFIVTGGNSGIGFEAGKALASRGGDVILACRNPAKASDALERIRTEIPDARVELLQLDLASLASVRDFAKAFGERRERLDVLINNAGVMALPLRRTDDGFEMQIGTNHLGHFALTGLLLPHLLKTPNARVVNVSSTMHKIGRVDVDDLNYERRKYSRWPAYGQSKLANLYFTYELQRKLDAAGQSDSLITAACHPGYASTNLQTAGAKMDGSKFMEWGAELMNRVMSQPAPMGALPTLYAAVHEDVEPAGYYGPDGFMENRGHPKKVPSTKRSHDAETAAALWDRSLQLTGVGWEALAG